MLFSGVGVVHARSWRDVLSQDEIELSLRGSSNKSKSQQDSRPGELAFEIEQDPFAAPSSPEESVDYNEENQVAMNEGERGEIISDAPTPSPTNRNSISGSEPPVVRSEAVYIDSDKKFSKANAQSKPNANTKSKPDNVFERQSITSVARNRDINSYRTSREFVPPTASPGSSLSILEVSNPEPLTADENTPTESPTEEAARYAYPENSVTPIGNPPRGYFNYDTSEESWYGPGYPVIMSGGQSFDDLVVQYANNAWTEYQPLPPIHPSEAMAIANGKTIDGGHRDYFYWDEFGPEGLGFGPWKETLRKLRDEPNQCGNVGRQSPIDIRPTGVACLEHHQIRTRRGDFRVFGTKNNYDLSILPNKLRVGVQRRPCKYIENPVCSEPDPPHADFPHGWPGFVDALHVDFKFPAEHRIYGKAFDGEMQIYHLHPGRKRLPVVSVLMEVIDGGDDGDAGHNEYLQEAIDGFQYEYDINRAKCAKAARENENRRLQTDHLTPKGNVQSKTLRNRDSVMNQTSMATGDGSHAPQEEGLKNEANHGAGDDDHTIEDLANAIFGGDRERLQEAAKLAEVNSTLSARRDIHRRRLAGIWNPHHESLVPSIYFYGYDGSLTEPPCSEIVSWFVIDVPMKISRNQLEQMKYLLFTNVDGSTCQSTSVHYRGSVARPIQETGTKRQIWHCTPNDYLPD